jgi:hypothetical protein
MLRQGIGRSIRGFQCQYTRLPSRHVENATTITVISSTVQGFDRYRQPQPLPWSLPGRQHGSTRHNTILRRLLHDLRGPKIRSWFLLDPSAHGPRYKQLRCPTLELCCCGTSRSSQAECTDAYRR